MVHFPLVFIHYAPVAGIRGLWIGPYINDTFGGDGNLAFATTAMSLSMIAGTFAYGPWIGFLKLENGLSLSVHQSVWLNS